MKLLCNKQSIYEAVTNVSKAVSERCAMPSLEGIKLKLENSLLELTGYDLEIGIRTAISVSSDDKGEFILNARLFSEMIKKMPEDEILMDVNENMQVTLSSGVTTYNLSALSADDYPELPGKEASEEIPVSQTALKSMINQTIFAVSQSDIKPILKGELFEINGGVFNLAAIDGYRLAVRTENIKFSGEKKFVVPSKTLSEVSKLLSDNDEDTCNIFVSPKHIIFEINGYLVYSRLLEGEFHPYKSAIPQTSTTEVIADRRELIQTLERAVLLINERAPSPVRCYFENGLLKIKCSTSIGRISDEIKVDMSGPVIEIGFKCKYLLDPLKAVSDDKVKLQMSGSLLPMKIVPVNGEEYTFLVLPVRLSKD
ncbi:DNA polymerase III subunit beta [Hominimerdicola sp. 21CYCFAH17_S]